MKIEDHIKYWLDSADHDLDVAENLFQSGKYDWCLFIGHLVLEKTLKALFVFKSNNQVPPKIHNLTKLAELSNLELSNEQKALLDKVNDFNIEARYPSYKFNFHKQCTKDFTTKYFASIKEYYKWLKSLIA
ncbi:HEPN domain-containing protein [candidate division KSB1 bacterium]|nr:HEPN domain-containing protein [candidate division KSB1 bacterium]